MNRVGATTAVANRIKKITYSVTLLLILFGLLIPAGVVASPDNTPTSEYHPQVDIEIDSNKTDVQTPNESRVIPGENGVPEMIIYPEDAQPQAQALTPHSGISTASDGEAATISFGNFGISPENLRLVDNRSFDDGRTLLYKQYYNNEFESSGIPVFSSYVTVMVTNDGKIELVNPTNYQPDISLETTSPQISKIEAVNAARSATNLSTEADVIKLGVYDRQLAWKTRLSLRNTSKSVPNLVYVDAISGDIIDKRKTFSGQTAATSNSTGETEQSSYNQNRQSSSEPISSVGENTINTTAVCSTCISVEGSVKGEVILSDTNGDGTVGTGDSVTQVDLEKVWVRLMDDDPITDSIQDTAITHSNGEYFIPEQDISGWDTLDQGEPYIRSRLRNPWVRIVDVDGNNREYRDDFNNDNAFNPQSTTGEQSVSWEFSASGGVNPEVNAFYHINRIRDYFRTSPTNINEHTHQMEVRINDGSLQNAIAHGDPNGEHWLEFGEVSGFNLGEYVDVLYHEYGHTVVFDLYDNQDINGFAGEPGDSEAGSMDEALADYAAATVEDDPDIPIVNRDDLDSNNQYPNNPDNHNWNSHLSSPILSGTLWDFRQLTSQDTADDIIYGSLGQARPTSYEEMYNGMLTVSDDQYNDEIWQAFDNHGMGHFDSTSPTVAGNIRSPSHSTDTWSSDDTVEVCWDASTDGESGIDEYQIKWDHSSTTIPTSSDSSVGPSTTCTTKTLSTGDNWWFHIIPVDKAGNKGFVRHFGTFKIDASDPSEPTPDDGINTEYTTQNDITFTWNNPGDTGSGVDGYFYELDGSSPSNEFTDPSQTSKSYTDLSDGTHTFYVEAYDQVGRTSSTGTHTVKIDTTAPETDVAHDDSTWSDDDTVSMAAMDSTSGIDTMHWRIDGGPENSVSDDFQEIHLNDGQHTIEYWSVDNAGNEETPHNTIDVWIDSQAPPAPSSLAAPSGWITDSNPSISWDGVSDSGSGVDHYEVKVDSGSWEDIGDTTSTTLSLSSGRHTIQVRAVDEAGNEGSSASTEVKVDTQPPTTSASLSGTEGSNGWFTSSDVSVTLDPTDQPTDADSSGVASTEYQIDGNGFTTGTSFTVSGDGQHTISFFSTDDAGNEEDTNTRDVNIDTQPPGQPSPTGPSGWTNDATISWSSVNDATSGVDHYEVRIDGGSWQSVSDTTFTPSTSLSDGTHTFDVRAVDTAGNTGSAGSVEIKIDTTEPPAPSSITAPTGWITDTTPTVSWDGVTDANSGVDHYEIKIDSNSWQDVGDTTSTTLSSLSSGTHTVSVRAVDVAGNAGGSAQTTVQVDVDGPEIQVSSPEDGSALTTSSVNVEGTVNDPESGLDTFEVSTDGGSTWTAVTVNSGSWSYNWQGLNEGSNTLHVRATDQVSNTDTIQLTVTVDTEAPSGLSVTGPSGWVTDATPEISWSGATDATSGIDHYELRIDGGSWQDVSGTSFEPSNSLSQGPHTAEVRAVDAAGNIGPSDSTNFQIDSQAPSAPTPVTSPSGWINETTPTISWSSVTDATSGIDHYEMKVGSNAWSDVGMTTSTTLSTLSSGSHSVKVRAVDSAGNAGDSASTATKIDVTAPQIIISEPADEALITNRTNVTVNGTAADAHSGLSEVEVSTDGGSTWTTVSSQSGSSSDWSFEWEIDESQVEDKLRVRAVDDVSNTRTEVHVVLTQRRTGCVNRRGVSRGEEDEACPNEGGDESLDRRDRGRGEETDGGSRRDRSRGGRGGETDRGGRGR